MAVICDGYGGMTVIRGGVREYVPPAHVSVNGRNLYQFNQETGVLKASMSPEDIARIVEGMGPFDENGKEVLMPGVIGPVRFTGVKSLESLANPEGQNYLMKLTPLPAPESKTEENPVTQTRDAPKKEGGLWERLKSYIK